MRRTEPEANERFRMLFDRASVGIIAVGGDGRLVTPDEFIPLAQQTGLIKPLTLYVLDEALTQCRAWQRAGLTLGVAVNLSVRNLLDTDFPRQVKRLLLKHEVDPALLQLEITESIMLSDPVRTKRVLDKLAAMGIALSIDDFGTGYSSLSYLSQLPVNEIKIDRSFVMNMTESDNDAVIVRSTIDLARNLGLQVVAEGVETEQAWDELSETRGGWRGIARPARPPRGPARLRVDQIEPEVTQEQFLGEARQLPLRFARGLRDLAGMPF